MPKYGQFLYDDIGNTYERKNTYLKELAILQEKENKQKEEAFIKDKDKHPYIKKLAQFEGKEEIFVRALKQETKVYAETLKDQPSQLRQMKLELFKAKKEVVFYKPYTKLSYDAELKYKLADIVVTQMGDIIHHLEIHLKERFEMKEALEKLDDTKNKSIQESVKGLQQEAKANYEKRVIALKTKQKDGLISAKAFENGKKEFKKELNQTIDLYKDEIPKMHLKQKLKSNHYEINQVTKQKLIVLRDNQANVRRTTPYEGSTQTPWHSYATFLVPGLGQLLNKQYMKAILFGIGALFIYLLAIPYILGYGNYQGEGLYGLVSLAEGGAKIHKSIIYMIEGLIALSLLVIGAAIFILSTIDTHKVQKAQIKGIRPKNWFESKRTILEEGFPYLVSLPTLVVLIFIVIIPIATALLLSFTNMDPKNQSKFTWVGLENYLAILRGEGMAGSVFWHIFGWTIIWTLVATTLAIFIGFGLAILANNERIKGKTFFRTVFLLPWAVPAFITIMFFSIMFSRQGILTEVIFNLTGLSLDVKNDPIVSRIILIMLQGWLGSAYIFLLSTGVLQGIPADLYEAADIDGSTAWQKLKRITLPLVLFQTAPLLVGQYTFNFNNFTIIHLFNGGGPFNPTVYGNLAGSTDLLISYIYKLTMDNQQQAIGAAITIVISFGLIGFAYMGFKNSKAFKEERL